MCVNVFVCVHVCECVCVCVLSCVMSSCVLSSLVFCYVVINTPLSLFCFVFVSNRNPGAKVTRYYHVPILQCSHLGINMGPVGHKGQAALSMNNSTVLGQVECSSGPLSLKFARTCYTLMQSHLDPFLHLKEGEEHVFYASLVKF